MRPLPNLPDPTAAPGPEDELVREVGGDPREFGFEPRDHLELAGAMIDMDRAAKLSGARFAYLKGDLVMLELALVRWALEKLRGHGFEPVIPPVLVRERALYGTGFLPDTEQQIYRLLDDDLYLAGTSEVALASLHDGEILEAERLPLRYAGFSPCFRREAGAAGKDTRGIFRVHQFDKVEMFSFVEPERSTEEHERILAIEEEILTELELPYRVVNIAVNDLGTSAAKKYDCEAWLPSQGRYRELTSCSNTTDYQARRLDIRVRREGRTQTLAHAQRHRGRGRAHDHRAARERSARGRHGRAARLPRRIRRPGRARRLSGRLPSLADRGSHRSTIGCVLGTRLGTTKPSSLRPCLAWHSTAQGLSAELDVVGLGRAGERAGEAELFERRLGHALDARRVRGFAARVGVVGEAAHLDGVLRRAVAGDADQVQVQRLAHRVQARGDRRLLADAVVRAGRLEEPEFA